MRDWYNVKCDVFGKECVGFFVLVCYVSEVVMIEYYFFWVIGSFCCVDENCNLMGGIFIDFFGNGVCF